MSNKIRRAAVRALDESEDGLSLQSAIDSVVEAADCSTGEARTNLLIVSRQEYKDGDTKLFLSSEYNAEEFLENTEPSAQASLDDAATAQPPRADSPSSDNPVDVNPAAWESNSFDLSKLGEISEAPMPTGETFNHMTVLKDEGHPLVPEQKGFIDQKHRGDVTEMEHFTYTLEDSDFGVIIEGEPGCAKGTMVKEAMAAANQPLVRLNMGVSITKEKMVGGFVPKENGNEEVLREAKDLAEDDDNLTVGKALDLLGAKDQFEWKDGLFTLAFRRGWKILVDEINAAEAETLMPFFGALEEEGSRSLELTEASESVEPHPNFRFIATMNPPHHKGTHPLNDALKDRCHHMKKDYLPQDKEVPLVKSMSDADISDEQAFQIVRLANNIRDAYPQQLDQTLTPRGCKRIADYTKLYDLEEAACEELLSRATYEDSQDALERAIETVMGEGSSSEEGLGELFG